MCKTWKRISLFGAVFLVFVLAFGVSVPKADAAQFNLSFAAHDPATTSQMRAHQVWIDRIRERTGGRVEITMFAGGSLAGPMAVLDSVKSGAADIVWVFTTFYPGQFPIADAVALPLLGVETTTQGTQALWDLYETTPALRADLNRDNFKLLMLYTNPRNFITTSKKPVRTVDDMKGLKLRAPAGTATEMVKAWGGVPILMGPGDIYQAVEKGVLDGFVFEYSGIDNFKLWEVAKFYTEIPFYVGPFLTLINKSTFDKLPTDVQKIIEEESGRAMSMTLAAAFQKSADEVRTMIMTQKGGTAIEISGATRDGFVKAADAVTADWIAKNNSASFDARAYVNRLRELVAKYAGS